MWWISERSGSINFPAYFINCNLFFSPHCEPEVEAIHEIKLQYISTSDSSKTIGSALRIANVLHNEQRHEDRRRCRAYAFYLLFLHLMYNSVLFIVRIESSARHGAPDACDCGDTARVNKLHAFYWMNSQRKYFHLFYFGKLVWVWRVTGDWWVSWKYNPQLVNGKAFLPQSPESIDL